jgi:cytidylate kinase
MPVITIARQLGAGGKTLGERVANKLGYNFYDNEIIQLIAERANVTKEAVHSTEKDTTSSFQKFISGIMPKTFADRARENAEDALDEIIYVDLLNLIIEDIARNDNAVILGRGGQYVLANDANTFHVLLIAEDEYRKKFLCKKYNLTEDQVVSAIKVEDRRRENLYRRFGKKDYDKWNNYHMIINMSKTDLETAIEQVCFLAKS